MDTYNITDLYLAAACIVGGCKFVGLELIRPGYYSFVFANEPETCEQIITSFRRGILIASVKSVVDAISLLKHEMNREVRGD